MGNWWGWWSSDTETEEEESPELAPVAYFFEWCQNDSDCG